MTSKEALEYLFGLALFNVDDEQHKKCREANKIIQKDLEILEIIKKWSFLDTFYREDADTTYEAFICNIHTKGMKEDYYKIKEWLEKNDM